MSRAFLPLLTPSHAFSRLLTPLTPSARYDSQRWNVPCLRWEVFTGDEAAGPGTNSIEFLGLWKDTGDRAMPIKMNVNPGNPNQVREAFDKLVSEMKAEGTTSGIFAAQSYNQMHWSANSHESGYKKHGLIGHRPEQASRSTWSGREHRHEGMRFKGFEGVVDILGGDWQNAVYKVTLGGDGGGGEIEVEIEDEAGGGDGWFRMIPQHRPEGHAICWTNQDQDAGKLKVSAHDARVHHGGKTNEATKIQIGPDDTDASLWRKVDEQVRWTSCGR